MTEHFIYDRRVQYMRKKKWRKCQLQIEVILRCQDKLIAIINDIGEKTYSYKFDIYGFECNNYSIGFIGANVIHHIKFETLELVSQMTELLIKHTKDVSYKIQLSACSLSQSVLSVDQWYTLHVQTNRICFTEESSSRLVTKWRRSNIGNFYIKDFSLNIEIISKNGKSLYTFYREEKVVLDRLFEAIKNLKFEFPIHNIDNFTSTPRRSVSVDLRRLTSWGNSKDKIARDRSISSRTDDSLYNYDSSPSSTPCTPSFGFCVNDQFSSQKYNCHIDEKDEELIFHLDSPNSVQLIDPKVDGYFTPNVDIMSLNEGNIKKLVVLERFPFEFDVKNRGKISPELHFPNRGRKDSDFIHNLNLIERSKNRSCYETMDSIKNQRKTCSEANFVHCKMNDDSKVDISRSADCKIFHNCNNLSIPLAEKFSSHYGSSTHPLSSSVMSSGTLPSSKSIDQEDHSYTYEKNNRSSPSRNSYSDHEYYNLKGSASSQNHIVPEYPFSVTDDSHYYNLSRHVSPDIDCGSMTSPRYVKHDLVEQTRNPTIKYIELDFRDNPQSVVLRKTAASSNYAEISILHTEALRDIDSRRHYIYKKKRPSFFKSIFNK